MSMQSLYKCAKWEKYAKYFIQGLERRSNRVIHLKIGYHNKMRTKSFVSLLLTVEEILYLKLILQVNRSDAYDKICKNSASEYKK